MRRKRSNRLSGAMHIRVAAGMALLCAAVLAGYELVQSGGSAPGTGPDHPNVLIIMWDTVRADRLSAYGYARPTTPFLEEFSKEAALYENAISPGIWTLPSHASLFTGLPATAHGATAYHKWTDRDIPRLSEVFAEGGYDTYMFSSNPFVSDATNLHQGFGKIDYVWESPWAEKTLRHTLAKLDPRDRSNGFSIRMNRMGGKRNIADVALSSGDLTQSGPVIAEAFEQWLDGRDSSRPFFAFLNYMEAHYPRICSIEARNRVIPAELIGASFAVDQDHSLLMSHMFGRHHYSENALAAISGVYDASLVDLDTATHELLEMMEANGLLDETVVVIVSDHGENLGDHGLMGHKYNVYNSVTRVPLILRYPPRVRPRRVAEPISVLDVYATVLDLAGLEPPQPNPHSISLLADSSVRAQRKAIVSEMLAPATTALHFAEKRHPDLNWTPWMRWFRAIERDHTKYIWASDNRHELYDMKNDPHETRNRYTGSPDSAEPLQEALEKWLGSFRHYDNTSGAKENAPPLSARQLEGLRAIGY